MSYPIKIRHTLGFVAIGAAMASLAACGPVSPSGSSVTPTVVSAPAAESTPAKTISTSPSPSPKAVVPKVAAEVSFPGDGMFTVGSDIKPGTYKSVGGNDGYWARLKNAEGGLDSIITNGNQSGSSPIIVTIKKTDKYFETNRFEKWILVK